MLIASLDEQSKIILAAKKSGRITAREYTVFMIKDWVAQFSD
jgi:hypothetical protein